MRTGAESGLHNSKRETNGSEKRESMRKKQAYLKKIENENQQ
jgi:hypothetical protein